MTTSGFTHEKAVNQTHEWYTPPYIFTALGVRFDMDVASPGKEKVPWIPADIHYTREQNGFYRPWKGNIWLNPPYGGNIPEWLEKLAAHGEGIALLFSRTETRWFQRFATKAAAICFLEKKVKFIRQDGFSKGQPGCGSILLAFGESNAQSLEKSKLGFCIRLKK